MAALRTVVLHARFCQSLPLSFGSLRFASSFKVIRKLLSGKTCTCIVLVTKNLLGGVGVRRRFLFL